MNKKREAEMQKLKRDLEEQHMNYESQLSTLKKKNQDAINELSDQIDIITKSKSKWVHMSLRWTKCHHRNAVYLRPFLLVVMITTVGVPGCELRLTFAFLLSE